VFYRSIIFQCLHFPERFAIFESQVASVMSDPNPFPDVLDEPKVAKVDQRHSKWGKLNRDAALNPFGYIDILKHDEGRPKTADTDYSDTHAACWD
jgi:hypothetical protein